MTAAATKATNPAPVIRVGVSTCLLGEEVRWDGGHKRDQYVRDTLGRYFTFVPVCPEVEVGMGTPREPVHLAGDPEAPLMLGSRSGEDWTDRMRAFCRVRVQQLVDAELCGYVLKRASPSCGLERVKVTTGRGMPRKVGRGLFAAELLRRLPLLPVEEEGRLCDAGLRENFIVRVFAYHRLRQALDGRLRRGDIVAFHAREKFLLMAHNPKLYRQLGQLVAAIKDLAPAEFRERYRTLFMQTLQTRATVRKNVDVLQHVLGYLKRELDAVQKRDIVDQIEKYRRQEVPLIVPLTLLAHYLKLHEVGYLLEQTYLQPAPAELALRNHV
jgi:uncharacterized protein YbgA (DUF1722 family)/uncharacterized protein YbbK (DUF523 family)